MRFPTLAALLLPLTLVACNAPAPEGASVEDAWVRLPAVAGRPGAAYFTVRAGAQATRLDSVGSSQIEKVELHDNSMEGGVMRMGPLEDRDIAAGAELVFAPGGRHAMLFGMAEEIAPGDSVPLYFRFSGDEEVAVEATVVAAGDPAPE